MLKILSDKRIQASIGFGIAGILTFFIKFFMKKDPEPEPKKENKPEKDGETVTIEKKVKEELKKTDSGVDNVEADNEAHNKNGSCSPDAGSVAESSAPTADGNNNNTCESE